VGFAENLTNSLSFSLSVDCPGPLSALGRRYEESQAGVRHEKSANTPAGKEDY
jgi:hypothetical protein